MHDWQEWLRQNLELAGAARFVGGRARSECSFTTGAVVEFTEARKQLAAEQMQLKDLDDEYQRGLAQFKGTQVQRDLLTKYYEAQRLLEAQKMADTAHS